VSLKRFWKSKIAGILLALVAGVLMGSRAPDTPLVGAPYHHLEGGFRNPPGSPSALGDWSDTVAAYTDRIAENLNGELPSLAAEYILTPSEVQVGLKRVGATDSLTWLGHASFLIRLNGLTILTDPFLTDYATGLPPFGPQRSTPPALTPDQLPPIHMIVVSHNHYDHLDAPTVESLPNKTTIQVVVPLGLGSFFTDRGYTQVTELDWYSQANVRGVGVTAVPAIHGSARGLFDRNQILWAGYVLDHEGKKIYFSGDTAYGPVFKQIGKKVGPVDYALVPIGAYQPRRRMKHVHVSPEEAVNIGQDLKARITVGMHWGTIRLSDEAFEEQPKQFRQMASKKGLSEERVWVLKIGESRRLN